MLMGSRPGPICMGTTLFTCNEHRETGTYGAFLLNSNGMDIKINQTDGVTSIEYNVIG
ncbi:hypothetical protein MPER_16010, partial [Moniliophthora perniciosa FA553]